MRRVTLTIRRTRDFLPTKYLSYASQTMSEIRRIAVWSGPRNISTAMMRAWGNRADTIVCDEPFYAHYLKHTGYTHHPDYEQIIANHESDWQRVVEWLTGPLPESKTIFYQKQMAQHLLPHIPLEWTDELTNVFLIRDPREMLLSLIQFLPQPTLEETGLPQQVALFERAKQRTGQIPAVIDARDVLLDPHGMLQRLCRHIDIPFDTTMLVWKSGLHETDGIWGRHWYGNVMETTGFGGYRPKMGVLADEYRDLLDRCQDLYDELADAKIHLAGAAR